MRFIWRVGLGLAISLVALTAFTGVASASNAICNGGAIPAGQYASITVNGICSMPYGQIHVAGNVTIMPGAGLDVVSHATLTVFGNVFVEDGGILGLGCSPAVGCSWTTHDHIYKALVATNPASLIVHSAIIGSVFSEGGSNGVNCAFNPVIGSPNYMTFEDNTINGNATVLTYDSCWFGFIRNSVGGSVLLQNNTLADPDAMEVVTNFILGDLACYGNSPAPQLGDSGGLPNTVKGSKLGQCAGL